ncbi:MAG: quinolinate synthase NadA [Candidatus Omnitrophica bacterium]|nr:quinolinate synthase NadA [Candidatus Omnitrophota bacterium]
MNPLAMPRERLIELVKELKAARRAVILAHNYQEGPIQEVADFVGDSLKLAQHARKVDEPVILFCGVHFMAETAAMLCPDKQVLVPDPAAGCTLADAVMPGQIRTWKRDHPGGVVVCYINTSAAVKAECDYCCTSSNGIEVIGAIPPEKEILFVPDYYLGSYLKAKTGRPIHLWKGYCPAHAVINPEEIDHLRGVYPDAEFLMHPECGCLTKQMDQADQILSTDGMIRYVKESPARSFIVATENGILYRMRRENPSKVFLPASEHASCHHMQRNTLEKVLRSLMLGQHEVKVEPGIARRALLCINRMLEIGQGRREEAPIQPVPVAEEAESVWWGDWVLAAANDLR